MADNNISVVRQQLLLAHALDNVSVGFNLANINSQDRGNTHRHVIESLKTVGTIVKIYF